MVLNMPIYNCTGSSSQGSKAKQEIKGMKIG